MDTEKTPDTVTQENQGNVEEEMQINRGNTEEAQVAPEEDKEATNIRTMRRSKETAEQERDDAYRKLKEYEALANKKSESPDEDSADEDLEVKISDDDLVEGKHLGKVTRKIKKLEEELKSYKKQSTATTVETQLKSKYVDFDKVVSKENVDALSRDFPELATTLGASTDLYSQAVTAYTMIKQMGIYKEDKYVDDRLKAEQNAAKPRPLASVSPQQGESPLSRANAFAGGLTDDLKKELLKEMVEARSRR